MPRSVVVQRVLALVLAAVFVVGNMVFLLPGAWGEWVGRLMPGNAGAGIAVPVRDGTGSVRAAMNVTVHAAETSTEKLLDVHLPKLLRAAGDVSADWAAWQSRPHCEVPDAHGATATS